MRKQIYRTGIAFQSKVWSGKEKMSEMGFRPCLLMRIRGINLLSSWHRAIFLQGFPYSIVTAIEFNHQVRMGWCGSSTPGTPEFKTMNKEGHKCTKGILANDCEAPILKRT
jgi:hypothetical protein